MRGRGWSPSLRSKRQTSTAEQSKKWRLDVLPTAAIHLLLHNCFTVAWNRECILMQSTHLLLSEGASVVVVALSRLCSRRLLANPRTVSLARPMLSPSILSTMDMSKRLGGARGACGKHGVGVGVGVGTLLNRCAPSQCKLSPLDRLVDALTWCFSIW